MQIGRSSRRHNGEGRGGRVRCRRSDGIEPPTRDSNQRHSRGRHRHPGGGKGLGSDEVIEADGKVEWGLPLGYAALVKQGGDAIGNVEGSNVGKTEEGHVNVTAVLLERRG